MDDFTLYGSNGKETNRVTNIIRIFSKDMPMEFGINKCTHVTMKSRKLIKTKYLMLAECNVLLEKATEFQ